MRFIRSILAASLLIPLASAATAAPASQSVALNGSVVGENGQPISHATAFVYAAHLKKGYAVVCPTCWVDCGKRADTDEQGHFVIDGLNPNLLFRVVVAKSGYSAAQKGGLDPAAGPALPIKLKAQPALADPRTLVRGRVVGLDGTPVAGALIEPEASYRAPAQFLIGRTGLNLLAVSDDSGAFELRNQDPVDQVLFLVSPRGLAPTVAMAETGEQMRIVKVGPGATIVGRLVRPDGKPVPSVEMALATKYGDIDVEGQFPQSRVGTDRDGKFAFTNVPKGHLWQVYPTESLVPLNLSAQPRVCETKSDGEVVNLGSVTLTRAFTLKGHVVGPAGAYNHVSMDGITTMDTRIAAISTDGQFEFRGVMPGPHRLLLGKEGLPLGDPTLEILVDHDLLNINFRAISEAQHAE